MAYGNASKKTVPQSALSSDDLDYIAEHINTAYGEKISGLEEDVGEIQKDIETIKESGGGSGGAELFVIQWDGEKGNKTYQEVSQAIAERKIPILYQGDKCIATFSGDTGNGGFVFARLDLHNISAVAEYILQNSNDWYATAMGIVKEENLDGIISANDPTFKAAVLNCFPDADTMSFPLENPVSEVSEE